MPAILNDDNVRHGLSKELDLFDADRVKNIRRVSDVAPIPQIAPGHYQ